ncbi:hypothetical protein [Sphingomonas sp. BK580]|nr:hypothetical protein [Sphingomonas sp. BK580]MBB3693617.1 hypothetical protein [Sphingomonas sp. BK580]
MLHEDIGRQRQTAPLRMATVDTVNKLVERYAKGQKTVSDDGK